MQLSVTQTARYATVCNAHATEEEKALSFGLNEHISTGLNRDKLFAEFEIFYQNISNDPLSLP